MSFIEITILSLAVLVATSIIWFTLRTGISPMLTWPKARRAMFAQLEQSTQGPFVDLGSGWGTLVIALAKKYPQQQVVGYELSIFPWLVSTLRKHFLGLHNLKIYRQDFRFAQLSEAKVLFCYLFPAGMQAVLTKINHELNQDLLVVSNTFALADNKPVKVIRLTDLYRTPIYVYFLPRRQGAVQTLEEPDRAAVGRE